MCLTRNAERGEQMAKLQVGDVMPDFLFDTPFSRGNTLVQAMGGVKTAIVFLRYYGCTLCRLDLAQYKAGYTALQQAGGQLLVVLQSDADLLRQELEGQNSFPFDIVCDPKGDLYQQFEILPAESKVKMAGPGTMVKIAKATAAGHHHGRYEGDELQLPAAFVLDADRHVLFAHYAKTVDDVPTIRELTAQLH